jgi:UDP-3-O-[3-hydroxymyristoyl] glucosamine N-acyltransferase
VTLGELARALGLPLEGDAATILDGLAGLDDAGPSELSFVTGPRYAKAFAASRGGAFLLPPGFDARGRPCLRSPNPYADFARAIELFLPRAPLLEPGVHRLAAVAPDAALGAGVAVGAFAVVGARARIGARTQIHPHVTLYPDVTIGEDCVIHSGAHIREGSVLGNRVVVKSGAVIGSEGFGHVLVAGRGRVIIPHRCPVEIGDDAEVGANATIDASHPGQARHGHAQTRTWIGAGVKIDNLVQVGHGCAVGENSTLCAQTGIAGSTRIGRGVTFAGQSAAAGHLEVGDGALITGQAAATGDVPPGAQMSGTPMLERRAWGRYSVLRRHIPRLFARVRRIEQQLGLGDDDAGGKDT